MLEEETHAVDVAAVGHPVERGHLEEGAAVRARVGVGAGEEERLDNLGGASDAGDVEGSLAGGGALHDVVAGVQEAANLVDVALSGGKDERGGGLDLLLRGAGLLGALEELGALGGDVLLEANLHREGAVEDARDADEEDDDEEVLEEETDGVLGLVRLVLLRARAGGPRGGLRGGLGRRAARGAGGGCHLLIVVSVGRLGLRGGPGGPSRLAHRDRYGRERRRGRGERARGFEGVRRPGARSSQTAQAAPLCIVSNELSKIAKRFSRAQVLRRPPLRFLGTRATPSCARGGQLAMAPQRRYQRFSSDDFEYAGDHPDPRFVVPEHLDPTKRRPKKRTVALALGLLFAGSVLLGCYALWFTGYLPLPNDEEQGTSTALLVLGCITFAPGLYVSAILAGAALGVPGVDYSMIPE